jgi:hypothetical protein
MRTWTETHREGTDVGPVDWSHPTAKDKPEIWREAEKKPEDFVFIGGGGFSSFHIISLSSYDGWPYWEPRPAICIVGPMGSAEWRWFDSIGVYDNSIARRVQP